MNHLVANILFHSVGYGKLIGVKSRGIDSGTNHFGAVVGNNSAIGASVIILPGRQVPHSTMIQAGTIFGAKQYNQ
jgi:acetyltransferase-like isoleucine patch superfamily enzyme